MEKECHKNPPLLFPFPKLATRTECIRGPREVWVTEFFTVSDGWRKTFTEEDCIRQAGDQQIKEISEVSYYNLFINGVLQPKINYEIKEGKIILKTIDAPIKGSPIILQMIKC